MSGTALYRALVHAGAPEDEAKEAADGIEDIRIAISQLDVKMNIVLALLIAVLMILIKSFF